MQFISNLKIYIFLLDLKISKTGKSKETLIKKEKYM